jgi:hypothetical protein
MNVLASRLGVVDFAKVLAIVLFITSAWFMLIYPAIEPVLVANILLAYVGFLLVYTAVVWYLMHKMDNISNIIKKANFFIMLFLVLFVWDLWLFPYMLTTEGVMPGLASGAKMSSDIFLHDIIPASVPEIMKYWMVYCLVPSILLAIVAVMSGTRKTFVNMTARGV